MPIIAEQKTIKSNRIIYTGQGDGFAFYSGRLFSAGNYPEKDISFNYAELVDSIRQERYNIQYGSNALFDGKLGYVYLSHADTSLYVDAFIPLWLHEYYPQEIKLYPTFNRATKKLTAVSME